MKFKMLENTDFVDQMTKKGLYSEDRHTKKLHSVVDNIERTCRGSSLLLCRDYKKFSIISELDWDQIVKCHHGHADKITLSGGVVFELDQYDWHRDRRIHDLKLSIP